MTPRRFTLVAVAGLGSLAGLWMLYLAGINEPARNGVTVERGATLIARSAAPRTNPPRSKRVPLRQRVENWADGLDDSFNVSRSNLRDSALVAGLNGQRELQAARTDRAIEDFERALRRDAHDPVALRGRAAALTREGRSEDAARDYRTLLERRPDDPVDRYNYGVVLCRLGRMSAAGDQFGRALELDPQCDRAAYNLASVRQQQGKLGEAIRWWRRFCERQPRVASAWFNLGVALADLERFAEAADCFRRAIDLQPDEPISRLNLAKCLRAGGHTVDALPHLKRAVDILGDDRDALTELIDAHRALMGPDAAGREHREMAVSLARRVLALEPDQPELQRFVDEASAAP